MQKLTTKNTHQYLAIHQFSLPSTSTLLEGERIENRRDQNYHYLFTPFSFNRYCSIMLSVVREVAKEVSACIRIWIQTFSKLSRIQWS